MSNLQEMVKKMKREYSKQWREKNPEKARKYNADYWERKAKEKLKQEGSK